MLLRVHFFRLCDFHFRVGWQLGPSWLLCTQRKLASLSHIVKQRFQQRLRQMLPSSGCGKPVETKPIRFLTPCSRLKHAFIIFLKGTVLRDEYCLEGLYMLVHTVYGMCFLKFHCCYDTIKVHFLVAYLHLRETISLNIKVWKDKIQQCLVFTLCAMTSVGKRKPIVRGKKR